MTIECGPAAWIVGRVTSIVAEAIGMVVTCPLSSVAVTVPSTVPDETVTVRCPEMAVPTR